MSIAGQLIACRSGRRIDPIRVLMWIGIPVAGWLLWILIGLLLYRVLA